MSGDVPSNSRTQAAELDALFRPEEAEPGPNAYRDGAGQSREPRGDDEAPWVKVPPFATQPQLWVRDMVVPNADDAGDYAATSGPGIDCLQERLLQLYFELTIVEGGGEVSQLSIIPEGSAAGAWYVVGVVDLTVTTLAPPSTRFNYGAGAFGSRTFYPSELQSPVFTGPGVVRFILAYDVSPFEAFRLNVLDLAGEDANNLLTLRYAFSQ